MTVASSLAQALKVSGVTGVGDGVGGGVREVKVVTAVSLFAPTARIIFVAGGIAGSEKAYVTVPSLCSQPVPR